MNYLRNFNAVGKYSRILSGIFIRINTSFKSLNIGVLGTSQISDYVSYFLHSLFDTPYNFFQKINRQLGYSTFNENRNSILIKLFLFLFFMLVLIKTAWIGDDAFITLRSVDNFLHGFGLRFNTSERVQTFTHPLWALNLILVGLFSKNLFLGTLIYSLIIAGGALGVIYKFCGDHIGKVVLATSLLMASKAFIDYTSSGLENVLSYLLIAIFCLKYFSKNYTNKIFQLHFIAALGILNRLDFILIYLPSLFFITIHYYNQFKPSALKITRQIIGCYSPLIIWHLIALIYYGFIFPNTFYAKLGATIPFSSLFSKGISYFFDSLINDPITLPIILLSILSSFILLNKKAIFIGAGTLLYLFYILYIGGDFMSGRFFSVIYLLSVLNLIYLIQIEKIAYYLSLSAGVILIGLTAINPPIFYNKSDTISASSAKTQDIVDERLYYYQNNGLLSLFKNTPTLVNQKGVFNIGNNTIRSSHQAAIEGANLKHSLNNLEKTTIIKKGHIGLLGYYGGHKIHIVDLHGITDPFVARMPISKEENWRIGHWEHNIPSTYMAIKEGENTIKNTKKAILYDRIQWITKDPIWSKRRIVAILTINTGGYNNLFLPDN